MDVFFERVKSSDLPAAAMRYEQPQLRRLVSLCRELQRHTGDRPFHLGCRTAGKLVDVNHATAWRWLCLLKADGVLLKATNYGRGEDGHQATRYFYIAGRELSLTTAGK